MSPGSPLSRPLRVAVLLLPLLLAWDASHADMALAHALAGSDGFPLRENAVLVQGLHRGGRFAAAGVLAAQAVHAAWPVRAATPGRLQRVLWLVMTLAGWLAVSGLKATSPSSCPWDLAVFGGVADYVGHWAAWQRKLGDGGPGRCFPSGHAGAGFAFLSLAFLWRRHRPQRATRFALAALTVGVVFGAGQVLRGAHFVSHVLWSAWCCWLLCAAVATAADALVNARRPAAA